MHARLPWEPQRPDEPPAHHRGHRRSRVPELALALSLWTGPLWSPTAAQGTAAITGIVVDRKTGSPVPGALVSIRGTARLETANQHGRFAHNGLAAGQYPLDVRAVGYAMALWIVTLDDGEVADTLFEIEMLSFDLGAILVEGRPSAAQRRFQQFERRRASGRGYFLAEEQIESMHARTLADLLRSVPGVQTLCTSRGCTIRMTRAPRDCLPDYFLDGFPATFSTSPSMSPLGIVGIEIYRSVSETPVEFMKANSRCGVVVIWTRSGP